MIDDTIAAISTPLGEGAIGIVRLSGRDAVSIADKLFSSPKGKRLAATGSHRLIYGFIKDPATDLTIDEALVAVMKAPETYTKEDIVEINCHGGILPLRKILELILKNGARLADPGEFTKRAFLNGRIDLSQAEAVMDIIKSMTDEAREVALEQLSGGLSDKITLLRDRIISLCAHIEAYIDFPEEDLCPTSEDGIITEIQAIKQEISRLSLSFDEGRFFRDGIKTAIVGRPNVGKSSLLNAFLERDRAIVTAFPGTTRDVLEEFLNIKGLPVRIMDTAGIRETHDLAEKEGVIRSLRAIEKADIIICLVDGSCPLNEQDIEVLYKIRGKKNIVAINKSDLHPADGSLEKQLAAYTENTLKISAASGLGLDALKDMIINAALATNQTAKNTGQNHQNQMFNTILGRHTGIMVTNIRHKLALDKAIDSFGRALDALKDCRPLEIVSIEMRDALDNLGEIVGTVATEDILNRIFSEFCIGK